MQNLQLGLISHGISVLSYHIDLADPRAPNFFQLALYVCVGSCWMMSADLHDGLQVYVMALLGCQTALHPSLEWSAPSSPFRDERMGHGVRFPCKTAMTKSTKDRCKYQNDSKCPIGGRHETRVRPFLAESSQVQSRNLDRQIDSGTRATRSIADHAVKLSQSAPSAAILPILRRNLQCPCIPKVAQKVKVSCSRRIFKVVSFF